jgi:hypothetical protein
MARFVSPFRCILLLVFSCAFGIAEDVPPSLRPGEKWTAQAVEDAKQDRHTIAYDGITPNKLVCDTTLRELPDGSWILLMLAGDDFEPSPRNYTGVTRSTDQGRTWTPLEPFDTGFPREGRTAGQGPTELMVLGPRSTLFFSTHAQTWGRDWRSWMMHSDDHCRTWSRPEPQSHRHARWPHSPAVPALRGAAPGHAAPSAGGESVAHRTGALCEQPAQWRAHEQRRREDLDRARRYSHHFG